MVTLRTSLISFPTLVSAQRYHIVLFQDHLLAGAADTVWKCPILLCQITFRFQSSLPPLFLLMEDVHRTTRLLCSMGAKQQQLKQAVWLNKIALLICTHATLMVYISPS